MLNYALLNSKHSLNEFTENLIELIQKSTTDVGYVIRTRCGTIVRSNELEIRTDSGGAKNFSLIDGSMQWNPDGSCFYSAYVSHVDELRMYDLISSESA